MTAVDSSPRRARRTPGGGPLASGALVAALLVLAVVLLDGALPWRLITVDTGSMHPTIAAGSLVVERSEPISAVQVGQIVTYMPPGRDEELTHRVVQRAWNTDGQLTFRTRGDANPGEDPWQAVAVEPHIWTVAAHLPMAGAPFAAARTAIGQPAVLAVLAALALGAVWIVRLRRRRPTGRRARVVPAKRRRAVTLIALIAVTTAGATAVQAANGDTAQAQWSANVSRGHSSATTGLRTPVLDAPVAGCLVGRPKVSLTWTSPSDVRTGVLVERQTGTQGAWTPVATVVGASAYTDTGPLSGLTTYTYRVRHVTASWVGPASSTRSVNTLQVSCLMG